MLLQICSNLVHCKTIPLLFLSYCSRKYWCIISSLLFYTIKLWQKHLMVYLKTFCVNFFLTIREFNSVVTIGLNLLYSAILKVTFLYSIRMKVFDCTIRKCDFFMSIRIMFLNLIASNGIKNITKSYLNIIKYFGKWNISNPSGNVVWVVSDSA